MTSSRDVRSVWVARQTRTASARPGRSSCPWPWPSPWGRAGPCPWTFLPVQGRPAHRALQALDEVHRRRGEDPTRISVRILGGANEGDCEADGALQDDLQVEGRDGVDKAFVDLGEELAVHPQHGINIVFGIGKVAQLPSVLRVAQAPLAGK